MPSLTEPEAERTGIIPVFALTTKDTTEYMIKLEAMKTAEEDHFVLFDDGTANWTLQDCSKFFVAQLRPQSPRYSDFTFFAIDNECISADPLKVILASDAADYEEAPDDPPVLKSGKVPLQYALEAKLSLELHLCTPTETLRQSAITTSVMPPPGFILDPDQRRVFKRQAIQGISPMYIPENS